jgi:hypothetical protein
VTKDSKWTASVWRIGFRKSTESIEAVTHSERQCLAADIEATISMEDINFPPNKVSRLFVSRGKTLFVWITLESEQGLLVNSVVI